jgi:hypothetical protein
MAEGYPEEITFQSAPGGEAGGDRPALSYWNEGDCEAHFANDVVTFELSLDQSR